MLTFMRIKNLIKLEKATYKDGQNLITSDIVMLNTLTNNIELLMKEKKIEFMDNENKNNQKQKIKIKANTFNKDKNNSILKNPMEIPLVLKNIVNTKKTEKITNKLINEKNYIVKEEKL